MGIGRWMHPFTADLICLPDEWYGSTVPNPCPRRFAIGVKGPTSNCSYQVSLDISGRGKKGGLCGTADTYTGSSSSGLSAGSCDVNIWKAYADGVWTSSTTVLVYCSVGNSVGSSATVRAGIIIGSSITTDPYINEVTITGVTPDNRRGAFCDNTLCPTTLLATVTINDDGTFSIA